jgi:hypothetical protein
MSLLVGWNRTFILAIELKSAMRRRQSHRIDRPFFLNILEIWLKPFLIGDSFVLQKNQRQSQSASVALIQPYVHALRNGAKCRPAAPQAAEQRQASRREARACGWHP